MSDLHDELRKATLFGGRLFRAAEAAGVPIGRIQFAKYYNTFVPEEEQITFETAGHWLIGSAMPNDKQLVLLASIVDKPVDYLRDGDPTEDAAYADKLDQNRKRLMPRQQPMTTNRRPDFGLLCFAMAQRSVAVTFKDIVGDHPVARHLRESINQCWTHFGDLFRKTIDAVHEVQMAEYPNKEHYDVPRPRLWEPPAKAVYELEAGQEELELFDGHYHEMMDRVSCLNVMFDSLIVKHSDSVKFQAEIDVLGDALASLYQEAANLHHEETKA